MIKVPARKKRLSTCIWIVAIGMLARTDSARFQKFVLKEATSANGREHVVLGPYFCKNIVNAA